MEKINMKLNVGLIITACLFLTAGLWEIIEMATNFYYVFSRVDDCLYFFANIHFIISLIFFGLYIILGYNDNKKLFGILGILCLAFYNFFWFVYDMYRTVVSLQYLSAQSIFMDIFNIFRSMTEMSSFIIMMVMISKRNKIGTIITAAIPVFMCFISPLFSYMLFGENFYSFEYWLLYLTEMSLFLLFAIFAFSGEKREKIASEPINTNNFVQTTRPMVNTVSQPIPSTPINRVAPTQPYTAAPRYTAPPSPQYVPVAPPIQNATEQEVVAQLKLIKQQFEAGQITEDTYNNLKNQLISKL